jgi:hypothetical protein
VLSHRRITFRVRRSLMDKPKGSNSTETELSRVNLRTEIKFLTMESEIKTLLRRGGAADVGTELKPVKETGSD